MFAFKTFAQCPEGQRPHAQVPLAWPWQINDCLDAEQQSYEGGGFTVLSDVDYSAYIAQHQASYNAWIVVYQAYLNTNTQFIGRSVVATKQWADTLMDRIKVMNIQAGGGIANGLWMHHRLRSITITVQQSHVDSFSPLLPLLGVTFTVDLINMITTGDAESVYAIFCCLAPDDMSQTYHGISTTIINFVKTEIASYLGWA